LKALDPRLFVKAVLSLRIDSQREVLEGLKSRYEHGGLTNDLKSEKAWLTSLRDAFLEKAKAASPFTRHVISTFVHNSIARFLDPPSPA
jgi:hypothetical protein